MCCGQKRLAMRSATTPAGNTPAIRRDARKVSSNLTDSPARSPVSLRYLESSPIRVAGPATGRQ